MTFKEYLERHYTAQEIAAMSREGLRARRQMFMTAQPVCINGGRAAPKGGLRNY